MQGFRVLRGVFQMSPDILDEFDHEKYVQAWREVQEMILLAGKGTLEAVDSGSGRKERRSLDEGSRTESRPLDSLRRGGQAARN
jgi:hypothetical protein